jgi:hypothetical protein
LSSLAQRGIRPHFIILATRLPSTERTAVSIRAMGGILQSEAEFGAGLSGSNLSSILISEKSVINRTRPHMLLM